MYTPTNLSFFGQRKYLISVCSCLPGILSAPLILFLVSLLSYHSFSKKNTLTTRCYLFLQQYTVAILCHVISGCYQYLYPWAHHCVTIQRGPSSDVVICDVTCNMRIVLVLIQPLDSCCSSWRNLDKYITGTPGTACLYLNWMPTLPGGNVSTSVPFVSLTHQHLQVCPLLSDHSH